MRYFNQCLVEANLEDLNYMSPIFTWWNKHKLALVAKKLDKSLVNEEWYIAFPSSVTFFGSPGFSDHAIMSIILEPERIKIKKQFRFYNFLTHNPKFLAVICESWFSFNITGSAMFRVSRKLKLLKKVIREFSFQNYSGIERKTELAHERLLQAQASPLSDPSTHNASAELLAMQEWKVLSTAETEFFFQRLHISWLSFGDGNSRLFSRYTASRHAINHIHFLTSEDGVRIESQSGIQELCVDYFYSILGSHVSQPMFIQSDLDLLFNFRCSVHQADNFQKPLSAEDIKGAFFSLPKNKIGGPDGYSVEFFTSSWAVIGPEITKAIMEFFKSGSLLKQWNTSNFFFIPKKPNASLTTDFRPISCLNTMQKVISKLLASRLKEILSLMVYKS